MFGEVDRYLVSKDIKEGYSVGYCTEVYLNALEMLIFSAHCDCFQWHRVVPLA
jgi:hypothetical protein